MKNSSRPNVGRPLGTTKLIKRTVSKSLRLTPQEWSSVQDAVKDYGVSVTEFMRNAVLEKSEKK